MWCFEIIALREYYSIDSKDAYMELQANIDILKLLRLIIYTYMSACKEWGGFLTLLPWPRPKHIESQKRTPKREMHLLIITILLETRLTSRGSHIPRIHRERTSKARRPCRIAAFIDDLQTVGDDS